MTFYEKKIKQIRKRHGKNVKDAEKEIKRYLKTGLSDCDCFTGYRAIAEYSLSVLKETMKYYKGHENGKIFDEIAYALEFIINDGDKKTTALKGSVRASNGMKLFAEYFTDIWY